MVYGFALLEGETIMIISITKPWSFSQLGNRESQEDCLCPVDANKQTSYFVVCDGVGGRDHGEVASKLVCQSIEGYLANERCSELKAEDILQLVEHAYYTERYAQSWLQLLPLWRKPARECCWHI